MNKMAASVSLPRVVREPHKNIAGPTKEPEHLALCRKESLPGFTNLVLPHYPVRKIATAVWQL
jgi:hypothetical protein